MNRFTTKRLEKVEAIAAERRARAGDGMLGRVLHRHSDAELVALVRWMESAPAGAALPDDLAAVWRLHGHAAGPGVPVLPCRKADALPVRALDPDLDEWVHPRPAVPPARRLPA